MSNRINEALEAFEKQGHTPQRILIGNDLYLEILNEQNNDEYNNQPSADLLSDGQEAIIMLDNEPTDYYGIPLTVMNDVPADYLKIE